MNEQTNVYSFDKNRLVNSAIAAEYLGYKRSYLYNLVHKGELKPYKCGSKVKGGLRFKISSLDNFLGKKDHDN